MNRYDFTQPGGFPLDQGVLGFIQDSINLAAQTAALAGPLAILSGCVVAGGSVGDGVVVINGEILPFTGGLIEDKVVINEVATAVIFQDDTPKMVKYVRTAGFGDDGVTDYLWASFQRNTPAGILARIATLETEVDALNTDVATLGAEITDLEVSKVTKLASGTKVVGDVGTPGTGGASVNVNFGTPLASSNYMVHLTIISLSANPDNDKVEFVITSKTTNGFTIYFHEPTSVVQNINVDWLITSF